MKATEVSEVLDQLDQLIIEILIAVLDQPGAQSVNIVRREIDAHRGL